MAGADGGTSALCRAWRGERTVRHGIIVQEYLLQRVLLRRAHRAGGETQHCVISALLL